MKRPCEIVQPIWDRWDKTNDITSRELVALVWNAAINTAADTVYNSTNANKTYQSIIDLKFSETPKA